MELMKDWLGPTIEHQLHRALQWKEQGSGGFQVLGGPGYEDDGSNLRVKLKKGGHLQIVKFETFKDPIRALLSDSHSSIHATFASSAVKGYTAKHRRRITDQTKGGIIAISEYEIVATHLGPKQSSVTLLVQDLHFGGCQGSSIFGQPVPVERRKGARQLVQQLRELKSVEVLDSSHHSQKDEVKTPSPVRSQVEAVTSDGGSDEQDNHSALATQVGFVSQMPRNKKTTGMVSESTPVQSPRHRPNTGQIAPEHYIAAPAATKANRRTTTHPDKLLGLLTGAQDPKTLGPRTNQTMKASRTLGVSVSKTSPESVNEPEKAAQHSETGEDADFRQSETPVSFLKEKLTNGHAETTAGLQSGAIRNREANIHVPQEFLEGNEVSAEQSRSQKSVLSTGQEAEDAMKETSQGNMQGQIAQTDGEKGERISNEFRVERAEGKKVDQHAINDPWKGMTRIRRRDVRIPKDQQKLLDRDNSWLPPEPGSRGPIANVPITVQQALSAVAERRALKSKLVDGQTEVAEMRITEAQQQIQASPDAGSESEHDSDGEKLSGWSASSSPSAPGDQLPPDSSLEVSEASPQVSRKDQLGDVATGRGMRDMGSGQTDSPKGMRGESAPLKDSVVTTQLVTDDAASVESGLPAEDLGSLQVPPGLGKPSNSKISEPLGQLEDVLGYDTSIHQVDNAGGQGDANEAPINGWKTNSGVTQGDIEGEHTSPEIQEDVRFHTQRPDMQSQVERSYSVYISSEEEDDCLESLVPNALVTEAAETDLELENGIAPGLPHPCTALQEGKPILQVKRTPYVSGEAARTSRSRQTSLFSLPSTRDESTSDSIDGHMSADYVMSSNSIIPSTHYGQANPAASDISPPEFGLDGSTEYMNMDEDEAMLDQQIHSEIDAHSQRSRSISPSKERSSGFGSAEVGRESVLPPLLHPDPLHPMPSLSLVEDAEHSKRKAAESDRLSSFVTKRRKHIKPPPAFNFSQDNRQTQDPSLLARAHRREFFISRRLDTAKVAEGTVDKTTRKGDSSEESAEDANQSPDLLSAEVAPMQIDHHSPETDLNAGLSESACYQADNGPSVRKSRLMSRDYTPQNISLATGIDLDRPIKPAGSAAVQEPQTCTALPSKMPTPAKGTIYDLFRNTYPDYTGELKHFLNMCNRINALLQGDRMEHRSLWDDFIVRHKTEYRKYLFDCTDRGEDPIPYEKFYRDEVDEPKYVKRILTPASLKDAIASGGRGDTAQQPKRTFTGSAKISDIAASAVESPVRGPTPRTTDKDIIDLTLGYPGPKDLTISEKASRLRRSLPWINSAQAEKTPSPSRINKGTPRSSLIGQSAPLTQTPSRESRLPQKAAQGRTPGRLRTGLDQSPSIGQPAGIVNTLPDGHDFPPRLDTSESNLPSVVEWLHMTSSDRAPSPVSERRKPNREEPEEDQWWRDRNTPFKAFARAYARLKSIEGNLGTIDQEGILRAGMRQVDVLGWSF